jgi:hypothetical protein
VVGQVTKRLGGVSKGFAIVGGLVLTGVLQSVLEQQLLSRELCIALALVVCRCAPRATAHCLTRALTRRHPSPQHLAAQPSTCTRARFALEDSVSN